MRADLAAYVFAFEPLAFDRVQLPAPPPALT